MIDRVNKNRPLPQQQRQQGRTDNSAYGAAMAQVIHGQMAFSTASQDNRLHAGLSVDQETVARYSRSTSR